MGLAVAAREGRSVRYSLVGATASGEGFELAHGSGIRVFLPADDSADGVRVEWLGSVAVPERLSVIRMLAAGGMTGREVTRATAGGRSEGSAHMLAPLRAAGFLVSDREGIYIRYRLAPDVAAVVGTAVVLTHPSGFRVTLPLGYSAP